jgi:hypothetical protein
MIDYQTFHQIRQLCDQEKMTVAQIAATLKLDPTFRRSRGVVSDFF